MDENEQIQEQEMLQEEESVEETVEQPEEESKAEGQQEDEEHKRETGSQREKRKRLQAERELANLRAEVESLKRGAQPQTPSQPQLADFNSVEEFLNHEFERREAAKRQREMEAEWSKREAEARKEIEDFEDAFDDFVSARPSQEIVATIMESPIGPKLAAFLGNHQDELTRIKALSPRRQIAELGKIEDRLTKKPEKTQTKAPPPIAPVRPASGGKPTHPVSRMEIY